jgi:endonuclease/exonuclease/phosphatase family metal-dependent hydrolase
MANGTPMTRRAVAALLLTVVLAVLPFPAGASDPLARPGDEGALRVMTYNVRFASERDGYEDWGVRRTDMATLLARNDVDILGTQELVAERDGYTQAADILAMLPGFTFLGRSRSADPNDEQMGVYYRESRLEALEQGHFWLSPTPNTAGSFGYGNQGNARMVTWARFLDEQTSEHFYLLNTHFDHASEPARYRAADQIAGYFENDAAYAGDGISFDPALPVVVTGDFNFARGDNDMWFPADAGQPTIDPIKPLRGVGGSPGVNQVGQFAPVVGNQSAYYRLVTAGPFVDTWEVAETTGEPVTGTFNGFNELGGAWIDWILARGDVRVLQSYVDTYRPNGNWPSDHVPVVADLLIDD